MPDYDESKIYAIRSKLTNMIYYGSTTDTLSNRFSKHKYEYNNSDDRPYCTSFEIFDFGDAYIELIEDFPCDSKQELQKREGEITKLDINSINVREEGLTRKQTNDKYYKNNSIKVLKFQKEYRSKNKDKIKLKRLVRIICDCGCNIGLSKKSRHIKSKKHTIEMDRQQYIKDKTDYLLKKFNII